MMAENSRQKSMKVELRLYASLACHMPEHGIGAASQALEVDDGTTITGLLKRLGVPQEQVKIIFRNGIHASGDEILKDGDRLGVFPPVAGG
jgi:molybdopterin synthase sulfur carrier subunit